MPRLRPAHLWLAGVLLGVAVIPLIVYSGRLYYAEGGRSPDAPGMLLASAVVTGPIWLGVWLAFCALFLIGCRGGAVMGPFLGRSPLSFMLALLATVATLGFLWLAAARVEFWRLTRLPFTLHLLCCATYCQFLRAAAVARSLRPGSGRPPLV